MFSVKMSFVTNETGMNTVKTAKTATIAASQPPINNALNREADFGLLLPGGPYLSYCSPGIVKFSVQLTFPESLY